MSTRGARLARAGAATAVATLVAALAHAAGGGHFPPVALLVLVFGFCFLATLALTTARLSPVRLTAAVSVCQAAFHTVFSMSNGSSPVLLGSGHSAHGLLISGSTVSGPTISESTFSESTVFGVAAPHGHGDASMLVAHVIAGVITVVALRYGEAAFWALVDAGRFVLLRLAEGVLRLGVLAPPAATMRVAGDGFQPLLATLFLTSRQHRGPPPAVRA